MPKTENELGPAVHCLLIFFDFFKINIYRKIISYLMNLFLVGNLHDEEICTIQSYVFWNIEIRLSDEDN